MTIEIGGAGFPSKKKSSVHWVSRYDRKKPDDKPTKGYVVSDSDHVPFAFYYKEEMAYAVKSPTDSVTPVLLWPKERPEDPTQYAVCGHEMSSMSKRLSEVDEVFKLREEVKRLRAKASED